MLQDYQQQLLGMMPCLLDNPKFLALLIRSVLDDAAPNYVQPILEEGMADGSIQTDSPRQLAQALLLLTDLWGRPHFTACPAGGGTEPMPFSQSAHPPLWLCADGRGADPAAGELLARISIKPLSWAVLSGPYTNRRLVYI